MSVPWTCIIVTPSQTARTPTVHTIASVETASPEMGSIVRTSTNVCVTMAAVTRMPNVSTLMAASAVFATRASPETATLVRTLMSAQRIQLCVPTETVSTILALLDANVTW